MYKIYNQKSIIFIYWMSQTLQECSIFVVLLLLLNLIETGHIQVWALTVTQMAAERLWSHKLCFLQIIFPTLVHTEARAWSCHLTAAAAVSQLQLHGSVFALYQLLFLPSWLSSSLPFFPEAGKSTGRKWPAPAVDAQLSLALQGLSGSFTRGVGTQPQPWHLQLLLLFRLTEKHFN